MTTRDPSENAKLKIFPVVVRICYCSKQRLPISALQLFVLFTKRIEVSYLSAGGGGVYLVFYWIMIGIIKHENVLQ